MIDMNARREGGTMILEGAGYRLAMMGENIVYTKPGKAPRAIDPFNPE